VVIFKKTQTKAPALKQRSLFFSEQRYGEKNDVCLVRLLKLQTSPGKAAMAFFSLV